MRYLAFALGFSLLAVACYSAYLLIWFSLGFEAPNLYLGRLWGFPIVTAGGSLWLCWIGCSGRSGSLNTTLITTMAAMFVAFLPSFTFWWQGFDAVAMRWTYSVGLAGILLELMMGGLLVGRLVCNLNAKTRRR